LAAVAAPEGSGAVPYCPGWSTECMWPCRFISVKYSSLDELPEGAVIGSAALRRQAQLLNKYPTLKIVNFRGNVQSRIRKLQEGQVRSAPVDGAWSLTCIMLIALDLTTLDAPMATGGCHPAGLCWFEAPGPGEARNHHPTGGRHAACNCAGCNRYCMPDRG
jgi:hypothetical protein